MNSMQWLNALDELLYEVMSWVLFLPVTLWRVVRHPLAAMDYADSQLALPDDEQYQEALSPPLFLALCLLLAHGLELALGSTNAIIGDRHGLAGLIKDDSGLLLLRLALFATFPLAMALRLVRRRGLPLDRTTLRLPFYAQCYPAAAFALVLSVGATVARAHLPIVGTAGLIAALAAPLCYIAVEARWFAEQLRCGLLRGLGSALFAFVQAFVAVILVGMLLLR